MRPLHQVRAETIELVGRLPSETVDLSRSVGRVLAGPARAATDVPHFDNSAMDGFAVRSEDVAEPGAVLQLIGDLPAGSSGDLRVGRGEAARILTGAPMPAGADTVIRVEETSLSDGKVTCGISVPPGNHIRRAGGDMRQGDEVIAAGTRLAAAHVGVLATVGLAHPEVSKRPRVAVMSTGDELRPADTEELPAGLIRDSNRPMLAAVVEDAGGAVLDLGTIPDDPSALTEALREAANEADVIISSGGVSMGGDYDVTKLALSDSGSVDFTQIAMKPGKPFGFGTVRGTPFFGLPGNPVSVLVSFEQLVRPALLSMQSAVPVLRPRLRGLAGEPFSSDPAKAEFIRVRLAGPDLVAHSAGGQGSNVLSGAAAAQALAVIPVGTDGVEEGAPVTLELWRAPETREAADVD